MSTTELKHIIKHSYIPLCKINTLFNRTTQSQYWTWTQEIQRLALEC